MVSKQPMYNFPHIKAVFLIQVYPPLGELSTKSPRFKQNARSCHMKPTEESTERATHSARESRTQSCDETPVNGKTLTGWSQAVQGKVEESLRMQLFECEDIHQLDRPWGVRGKVAESLGMKPCECEDIGYTKDTRGLQADRKAAEVG